MRRIRRASLVFVVVTVVLAKTWPAAANALAGPRPGTQGDAKALHAVTWLEPGTVVAAIENTDMRDLLFDVGVVHVLSSQFLTETTTPVIPRLVREPMITTPLRLAARSVTIVRLPASNLIDKGIEIWPSPALASRVGGKLTWMRVFDTDGEDLPWPRCARRGDIVTRAWRHGTRGGLGFVVFDGRPWLRWVWTGPEGRMLHPDEDHAPLRRWLEDTPRSVNWTDLVAQIERRAGTDRMAVVRGEGTIYLEIDTAKVEGHVLSPCFQGGDVKAEGWSCYGGVSIPPLLVYDADEKVVNAP
ncbi:MAG TPA: hypothetical protein VFF73_26340 [Planctomycetota bacterium]|nr:hypothetical protein [Planctomycetota bacterium]